MGKMTSWFFASWLVLTFLSLIIRFPFSSVVMLASPMAAASLALVASMYMTRMRQARRRSFSLGQIFFFRRCWNSCLISTGVKPSLPVPAAHSCSFDVMTQVSISLYNLFIQEHAF